MAGSATGSVDTRNALPHRGTAVIEPNSKVGTLMGWLAAIGGFLQLLGPRLFAATSNLSTFLIDVAPGVTAITGVCILAYQSFRQAKRKEAVEDQKAFETSWQGKVAALESELSLAKAERQSHTAEIEMLKLKDLQHVRHIKKLKAQAKRQACPFVEDGQSRCLGQDAPVPEIPSGQEGKQPAPPAEG